MIDLLPTEEQQHLVEAVLTFLAREMPIERLRPKPGSPDLPAQRDRWAEFAELGWLGLGLSEAHGGSGCGAAELMLVFREFGRYLLPPELVAAVVASRALEASNAKLAMAVAAGHQRVGLALRLSQQGADSSQSYHLLGYDNAARILETNSGVNLYQSDSFRQVEVVGCIDGGLKLHRGRLLPDTQLCSASEVFALEGRLLFASMLAGIAEAARDVAVNYAKAREQFGRTIGSFQAVKHICADMAVRAEAAYAIVAVAALSLAANEPDAAFQVASAASIASAAAVDNASQALQVHGGLGFTLECDVHLYLKRAHVLDRLLGNTQQRRRSILGAGSASCSS
jgi:alkylation response protein AidB-like acyl-CoA dehydrogenase